MSEKRWTGNGAISVETTGMNEILEKLEELGRRAVTVQKAALEEAAQPIYNDALARAPVRTGWGRGEIAIGPVKKGTASASLITVGIHKGDSGMDDAYYMRMQEYGTSRMPAHSFLGPAYEGNKDTAYATLREYLRDALGL